MNIEKSSIRQINKLTTVHIYRERGYIRKTVIPFGKVTVGLASKTLRYPFEFSMTKYRSVLLNGSTKTKANVPKLIKYYINKPCTTKI